MRQAIKIILNETEKSHLEKIVRSRLSSIRLAQRAQIVLLASQGMNNIEIAQQVNLGRVAVARWRDRYHKYRFSGIEQDRPRGGAERKIDLGK